VSDSKDVGPDRGLANAVSLAQMEGKQHLPEKQRQLEASSNLVDLWLENLHTSIDRQQVDRIVSECIDKLRSIAQVSAQSAMTEAFELQVVSQHFNQLAHVASLHTDAATRDRIEILHSIVLDSALFVKQYTTEILDMCLRLHGVEQNAPGQHPRNPSRTSASRNSSRTNSSINPSRARASMGSPTNL